MTTETTIYTYEFSAEEQGAVRGATEIPTRVSVEIPKEWREILDDLDREEYNNSQRWRKHSVSLDAYDPEGKYIESKFGCEQSLLEYAFVKTVADALTDRQYQVFYLYYCKGLTMSETADAMGISTCMVSKICDAIRQKVKNILEGGMA